MKTQKQTLTLVSIIILIVIIAVIVIVIVTSKNKKVIAPTQAITTEETSSTIGETTHYAFVTEVYQKNGETFVILDYVDVITCTEEKYKDDRNVCDEQGKAVSPGGNLNLKNENPKLRTFSLKNTKISLLQAYTDKNPDSSGQPKQISDKEFYSALTYAKNTPMTPENYKNYPYYAIGHTNDWDSLTLKNSIVPSGAYHMLFTATEKDGQLVELFQNYQA